MVSGIAAIVAAAFDIVGHRLVVAVGPTEVSEPAATAVVVAWALVDPAAWPWVTGSPSSAAVVA